MISKHIDLLAVGALLLVFAAFSSARHVVVFALSRPAHVLRLARTRVVLDHARVVLVAPPAPAAPPAPLLLQQD